MNDKSWRDTVKHGVSKSKPVYAAQMAIYQAYMEPAFRAFSANPALFTAINKDSEGIWFELVPFDGGLAQRMSDPRFGSSRQRTAGNCCRAMRPRQRMSSASSALAGPLLSST